MPDLSFLQKLAIELVALIICGIIGLGTGWHYKGVLDDNADAAKLVVAQNRQNLIDKRIQDLENQIGIAIQVITDNQAEADSENKYAIKLEKEIKAHPLPTDCKPSIGRVQWINNAGKN